MPDAITVWNRSPRRVASALTATLPLCETSATAPGAATSSVSPHSATRRPGETIPLQLGPQTGSRWRSRRVDERRLQRVA